MHHTPWRFWRAIAPRSLTSSLTYCLACSLAGSITGLSSLWTAAPVEAAEHIYFDYGILGLSIPRQDLDAFAETGAISRELKPILSRIDTIALSNKGRIFGSGFQGTSSNNLSSE